MRLTGFSLGNGQGYIGQLLYADDCLMAVMASMSEAKVENEVLRNYYNMSDQKVNISKSHVIFGTGVAHRDYIKIKRELQITQVPCSFQYLGVNIGTKCLPMSAFNPMLERIRNNLSSWKAKALPFPGKVTLVQAVIQSISVYLLSTYGYQRLC